MNGLRNVNLEALKRPPVLISVLGVLVLLVIWYFGWMTPEASKLSNVNEQKQSLASQLQTLQLQLQTDRHDSSLVGHDAKYLSVFAAAVPNSPEAGPLTTELYNLSKRTGVTFQSLTDDSTTPPAPGGAIGSIPISMSFKGTHRACLAFMAGIYKLPRLITVSSVTPTPAGSSATPVNVLANDNLPYTMTIAAKAYYFSTPVG